MVEASVSKETRTQVTDDDLMEIDSSNSILKLSGTTLSVLGKVALAIGTTGLLMFLFGLAEGAIGLGAIYTGCIAVGSGIATMFMGNKLQTGFWLEGALV